MNVDTIDLNLLVALRALLRERNVTRAGRSIGLSQPSMSAALARLRRIYGDELLTRTGNSYQLTPLAADLLDRAEVAYGAVSEVFAPPTRFDPAAADREFVLVTSDYAQTMLAEPLSAALRKEAPNVRLRLPQIGHHVIDDLDRTMRQVDGLLTPHGVVAGYPSVDLYQDRWVCLVSADNPEVGDELTLEELSRMPWVVMYGRPGAEATAFRQLTTLGIEPRIEVAVETFLGIPFLVAGTRRVALIQERLAHRITGLAAVRVLPCPFAVSPLTEALWYHSMLSADPAHRWFRDLVRRVSADIS